MAASSHRDVASLAIHGAWIPAIHAGMTKLCFSVT
jgi:hypothetical protein